jgi:hypothetical protein
MLSRQCQFSEDLTQLLLQVVAFDEKALEPASPRKAPISRQQKTPFGTGQTHQLIIVQVGGVSGIVSQYAQPLGQTSQHTVNYEFHFYLRGSH